MKAQKAIITSVAVGVLLSGASTTCGAKPLPRKDVHPAPAQALTPELTAAEERVNKAKTQLETARKQLDAARALLRAAQAEYKAAQADREALSLRTTAQGLADASGLQQLTAQAPATATASASKAVSQPQQGRSQPNAGSAGRSLPDTSQIRIQQFDFNAEPAQPDSIPLR